MPAKMSRSGPRPPFRLREVSIAVRTLRLSCRKAGKAPIFTPVRKSSWGIPGKSGCVQFGRPCSSLSPPRSTCDATRAGEARPKSPCRSMRTDQFDFALPEDRIALRPASPRDAARLLVVRSGAPAQLEDRLVRDLPELLRAGDAMVVNDTKVIPAFLRGRRIGRGEHEPGISANLIKRLDGSRWRALAKPARRSRAGDVVRFRQRRPGLLSRSVGRNG